MRIISASPDSRFKSRNSGSGSSSFDNGFRRGTPLCYSELAGLSTFRERYEYLRLNGAVGKETFGFDRYMNQAFYRSPEWRRVRDIVIARDNGCDLGIQGREIFGKVLIHHMNPILPEDIRDRNDMILDPEYLITTTHETHLAIHYGDDHILPQEPAVRFAGDTCPWRR